MKLATLKSITSPPLVTDGVGCNIRRIIQSPGPTDMDPLLLFDYFSAKAPAGFYDHPHRGFQMATYMVKGTLVHEDFQGNKTKLGPGDYSWANIGRGVVQSAIPASSTEEAVGFMLWVNLPKQEKFSKYMYSKFQRDEIPALGCEGVKVKVLAGSAYNVEGAVKPKNELLILDVEMQDECIFEDIIPRGWNSLCFVYDGVISIGSGCARAHKVMVQKDHAVTFEVNKDDRLLHIETRQKGARFLLVGGKPLNEPVHQHGPFVLATQYELKQAFEDYNQGINGFEGVKKFRSELGGRKFNKTNKNGAVSRAAP